MKRQRKRVPSDGSEPVTFETVRRIARELPGAEEGTSYGTPAFKVGGRLFVRQHQDGESLVVKTEPSQRAMRMRADPETFYITDHYINYPWVLVRLASVDPDDLRDLLEEAWRISAPKRLLSARVGEPKRNPRERLAPHKPRDGSRNSKPGKGRR
jgi:hypothetical protein